MSGRRPSFKRWEDLSDRQQRQVYWALNSLESFAASTRFLTDYDSQVRGRPLGKFIVNAQYSQLHDYYHRDRNLRQLLVTLDCADLLSGVDLVLETVVLGKPFHWILNHYRRTFLAHASYDPDEAMGWAPKEYQVAGGQRIADLLVDLGHETSKLYGRFKARYPRYVERRP